MPFLLISTSFQKLSIDELGILEDNSSQILEAMRNDSLIDPDHGEGMVLLATCNRFELYLHTHLQDDLYKKILSLISNITSIDASGFQILHGNEVIDHLFRVTSGLESMVIGDSEISGQVKKAFTSALSQGLTNKELNRLFQKSITISKKVASETELGATGRSIANRGLEILESEGFDFTGKEVMVVGTGAYSRIVIAALERKGVDRIYSFSSSGRAASFSKNRNLIPVESHNLAKVIAKADLIIACSGAHGTIIGPDELALVTRPVLPILDLSLRRDVDKSVGYQANIRLIDLTVISSYQAAPQLSALERAEAIVRSGLSDYLDVAITQENIELIKFIRDQISLIASDEIARLKATSQVDVTPQLEKSIRTKIRSIFHHPTVVARELDLHSNRSADPVSLIFDQQLADV